MNRKYVIYLPGPSFANLRELCEWANEHREDEMVDWTSLPTFGGEEPESTIDIWSWDQDSLMLHDSYYGFYISPREEVM